MVIQITQFGHARREHNHKTYLTIVIITPANASTLTEYSNMRFTKAAVCFEKVYYPPIGHSSPIQTTPYTDPHICAYDKIFANSRNFSNVLIHHHHSSYIHYGRHFLCRVGCKSIIYLLQPHAGNCHFSDGPRPFGSERARRQEVFCVAKRFMIYFRAVGSCRNVD